MSGIGIQLRPTVVDVDDMQVFWFYVLPNDVPCSRRTAKAEREESSAAHGVSQLSALKAHDTLMHELRRLVSVASFNLTEPNEPTHREPRCCDTHRTRNAEDRRRIKHRYYASKLLKVKRGMDHMECDEDGVHIQHGSDEPCLCQHCILVRYRTGKLKTRRGEQQMSFWAMGRVCFCKVCRQWFANNPHHPILRDPFGVRSITQIVLV